MRVATRASAPLVITLCVLSACASAPKAEPAGHLMDKTTAGVNRCAITKSHTRPFVLEWDATDLAAFEAKAAHDVVFVRYEGCHLTVLDCGDASVRGRLGAYRAPEWTAGGIEGFEITTEQDLYAQLPLGAASLAGRLESGETLRLRYFVSGVATATRDSAYKGDLPTRASCSGATHFVYAYNLGAFELAASARSKAGPSASGASVLKRGGEIDACRDEATRATRKCAIPIRIALRELEEGAAPAAARPSAGAKDAMAVLLEAGKIRNAAMQKLVQGDGVGCLRDLERAAEIDPDPEHIEIVCQLHAQCTMRAGKCGPGKDLLRACYRRLHGNASTPEAIETLVKSMADTHCVK